MKVSKTISFIVFILISSAIMAQSSWNYISPKPGSKYINPESAIAFRQGDVLDLSSIRSADIVVTSSSRGEIDGNFILSRDLKTLIFYPDQDFVLKEKIHVSLNKGIRTMSGLEMEAVDFSFSVMEVDNSEMLRAYYEQRYAEEFADLSQKASNMPQEILDFPYNKQAQNYPEDYAIPVVTEFNNPSPGYVFATTFQFVSGVIIPGYNIILDQYGTAVFYRKYPEFAIDLKLIPNNRLAVSSGLLNSDPINKYLIMDSHFNIIDSLFMGNGYMVDGHELIMLENGNHLMMAYDPQPVGMDTVVAGGDPDATVIGMVLQELDADNNVILQWRSWDAYEITDDLHSDLTSAQIDYVHGNAIELDQDGNILMSQRTMDEITKIDRNTAEIIWRFGLHAKNNMFTFPNDPVAFTHQHDVRILENGNMTLYDNGNFHAPPFSQSLEYEVDQVNMIANKVWAYQNDPGIYAMATGSTRRTDDGNVLTCWGFSFPVAYTEVTPEKEKTWQLEFSSFSVNYRAVKDTWVTDLFETNKDTIDYGEYDDYVAWPRIFTITNNADYDIQITSTHNHWDSYYVSNTLPLTVPANGTANMTVNFFPAMQGQINDVLTLNYESMFLDSLPQRISRQIFLTGFVPDEIAPVASMTPIDLATSVSQLARPTISFDEPVVKMGGETIKNDDLKNMIVFKELDITGDDVAYSVSMDAWKTKITIVPDTLLPSQAYYIELKANSVQDNEGNVLAPEQISMWETEENQGVNEPVMNRVSVYPNPTTGSTFLQFEEELPLEVQVMDIMGKIIMSIDKPSNKKLEIDLNNEPSGIYFVKMVFDDINKPQSLKILKK